MPKPRIHSIEVAITREHPNGRKVTSRAIVKPAAGSFAQFGSSNELERMNVGLLARFAAAAAKENELPDAEEDS